MGARDDPDSGELDGTTVRGWARDRGMELLELLEAMVELKAPDPS